MTKLWLVLCLVWGPTTGYKILMLPTFHHSHVITYARVGKALKDAGNDVDILVLDKFKKTTENIGVNSITFHPKEYIDYGEDREFMNKFIHTESFWESLPLIAAFSHNGAYYCQDILQHLELQELIERNAYDLVVVEGAGIVRCLMVVPYRHNVKYMVLSVFSGAWGARVSDSPSAEGCFPGVVYDDPSDPTIFERWKAFILEFYLHVYSMPAVQKQDFLTKYAANRPEISMAGLYPKAELFVTQMESFCLDQPRTQAAHYKYLGGLNTVPAKPLQGVFRDFAGNASQGLVVTSFGSAIKEVPPKMLEKMMVAFGQIPQRVIMRHDGPMPATVPENVLLSKWLPQNDLLGHPNTVLFITHGGRNGQTEALFHGIPLLTLPTFGDQSYNGKRAVIQGFGKMINFHQFTSKELVEAVKDIVNDPGYKARIENCSRIVRAVPDSKKTLVFWVEHILKHGGEHLKPAYINMPAWKYFSLDILFVCFVFIHFLFHIARHLIKLSIKLVILIIRKMIK